MDYVLINRTMLFVSYGKDININEGVYFYPNTSKAFNFNILSLYSS